jgi:hypothetical protein
VSINGRSTNKGCLLLEVELIPYCTLFYAML